MEVILTTAEQAIAQEAGRRRYHTHRVYKSAHRWNRKANDHSIDKEVEAIGAEMACARALGLTWVDHNKPDPEGDLGPGIQVRHTRYRTGKLLLHKSDSDDHVFYLVTGNYPNFTIAGWITGERGKRMAINQELQPGRPCMCVDQRFLEPLILNGDAPN